MKYQKELTALQEYIANFDPEEFTSSSESVQSMTRTPEQMARVQKLRVWLKRKRQRADTFQLMIDKDFNNPERIITQEEVDALLEKWALSRN